MERSMPFLQRVEYPCGGTCSRACSKTTSTRSSAVANAHCISEISSENEIRYKTGFKKLDRVLGGGIVKGEVMLISGDPGIGKSTIMLPDLPKLED